MGFCSQLSTLDELFNEIQAPKDMILDYNPSEKASWTRGAYLYMSKRDQVTATSPETTSPEIPNPVPVTNLVTTVGPYTDVRAPEGTPQKETSQKECCMLEVSSSSSVADSISSTAKFMEPS